MNEVRIIIDDKLRKATEEATKFFLNSLQQLESVPDKKDENSSEGNIDQQNLVNPKSSFDFNPHLFKKNVSVYATQNVDGIAGAAIISKGLQRESIGHQIKCCKNLCTI